MQLQNAIFLDLALDSKPNLRFVLFLFCVSKREMKREKPTNYQIQIQVFFFLIWFMYICGLILFCTIFIYDFPKFDLLVFLCLILWVRMIFSGLCSSVFLMKRLSDLNSCVFLFLILFFFLN